MEDRAAGGRVGKLHSAGKCEKTDDLRQRSGGGTGAVARPSARAAASGRRVPEAPASRRALRALPSAPARLPAVAALPAGSAHSAAAPRRGRVSVGRLGISRPRTLPQILAQPFPVLPVVPGPGPAGAGAPAPAGQVAPPRQGGLAEAPAAQPGAAAALRPLQPRGPHPARRRRAAARRGHADGRLRAVRGAQPRAAAGRQHRRPPSAPTERRQRHPDSQLQREPLAGGHGISGGASVLRVRARLVVLLPGAHHAVLRPEGQPSQSARRVRVSHSAGEAAATAVPRAPRAARAPRASASAPAAPAGAPRLRPPPARLGHDSHDGHHHGDDRPSGGRAPELPRKLESQGGFPQEEVVGAGHMRRRKCPPTAEDYAPLNCDFRRTFKSEKCYDCPL